MCREVQCASCHKRSWAGCGMHAAGVMANIPKDEQCLCKPVPGAAAATAAAPPTASMARVGATQGVQKAM